jgi:hypothetical protein
VRCALPPSRLHEALLRLVRDDPAAALGLLPPEAGLDPTAPVRLVPAELTEPTPLELRADLVLVVGEGGPQALGLVVEAQLQVDAAKQWTWPAYLALLRVRHQLPFGLVVITPSPAVAAWARRPIELGPGGVVLPMVLGPDEVPALSAQAAAGASPTRVTLGALMHQRSPAGLAAALTALRGAKDLPPALRQLYIELIMGVTGARARAQLEATMQVEAEHDTLIFETLLACLVEAAQAEGMEKGIQKGIEEGMEKGMEQGMEKGIEEGIAKGNEEGVARGVGEGIAHAVRHAWRLRFPGAPMGPEAEAALVGAEAAALDDALQIVILASEAEAARAALSARLGPASAPR